MHMEAFLEIVLRTLFPLPHSPAAKKYKLVSYDAPLLLKGPSDDVRIVLISV